MNARATKSLTTDPQVMSAQPSDLSLIAPGRLIGPGQMVDTYGLPPYDGAATLTPAGPGDHHAIHDFLMAVFQGPPRDLFLATLDDPFYEPSDRLLVRRGHYVLAHAHVTKREMRLDGLLLPVAGLARLGSLPECRGQGHAQALLNLAERRMAEDGAALGLLRTDIPHFFRRNGWAVCGRHSHSRAGARDVLAVLGSRQGAVGTAASTRASLDPNWTAPPAISVRPWRQVELPALMRLYQQCMRDGSGALARSEAYWRWLISCQPFDQIFVAVAGPDRMELNDCSAIVGYVVTHEDRVLELMADPAHPAAEGELLARACGEAIEQNQGEVTFHGPPGQSMHALVRAAGGAWHCHEAHQGEVFMVKVFDPLAFLRGLCDRLHQRAEAAGLTRPSELGLLIEGHKLRIDISRRGVKVARGKLGRSYLSGNIAEFTRLVLGHLDLDDAVAAGRLETSTRLALQTAAALFPRLPLWRSPLDDMMV
jgi:predicted N-acetyltransferase YhbS